MPGIKPGQIRTPWHEFWRRFRRQPVAMGAGIFVLLLIAVVGTVTAGDRFFSTDNFLTILRSSVVLGIVAVGMTFVITGGGIDLSVGSIIALTGVLIVALRRTGAPIAQAQEHS